MPLTEDPALAAEQVRQKTEKVRTEFSPKLPARKRDPRRTIPDSTTMVRVFNKTTATYKHGTKVFDLDPETGKQLMTDDEPPRPVFHFEHVELPPGGTAEVPENVADTWQRISGGGVVPASNLVGTSDASLQLDAQKAVNGALQTKLEAAEKRIAELEAAQAPVKPAKPAKVTSPAPAADAGDSSLSGK
jgi:hypothetical protein